VVGAAWFVVASWPQDTEEKTPTIKSATKSMKTFSPIDLIGSAIAMAALYLVNRDYAAILITAKNCLGDTSSRI
jgi:hypothetical protein